MSELFDREIAINAGGVRIASRTLAGAKKPSLRVSIKIERTLQKDPNSCDVSIWNLAPDSRAKLQEKGILTEIEAGYFGNTSVVFRGDLDYGATQRQGPDLVTTFQATDGGKQFRPARINLSFDSGTAINDVIRSAAGALGVGLGNLEQAIGQGNPRGAVQYVKGLVMSGPAQAQIDKVLKRAGYEWSIQDGQLQITRPGQVLNPGEAIVLRQGTGLIGSPDKGEKGIVNATSLLQPELLPGKRVEIKARELPSGLFEIDGFFRVDKVKIVGDTGGSEWYSQIEARPL